MRVAIMHYHLRPCGLTRVIQNALSALAETNVHTVVVTGEPPSPPISIPNYIFIKSLGYRNASPYRPFAEVVKDLGALTTQALGGPPDIWHIHNHALGKNLTIPEIVYHLAQEGQRLVLQIHDFSEDSRPDNYTFLHDHLGHGDAFRLGNQLYPQGTHVHYALINQRDLNFLKAAGVERQQLHYLPNTVSIGEDTRNDISDQQTQLSISKSQKLFLYPVRPIRRKNIGEFLLWSSVAEEGELFAIAGVPKNPLALPLYEDWVAFATSLNLPVEFALDERWQGNFISLLKSADAHITTSIAEGFGLSFLDPWLVMCPLFGRNLPEITGAIESRGIDLSALYHRLKIPLEWVGRDHFQQAVSVNLKKMYASYGRTAQPDDVARAVEAAITGEYVDFGRLNEPLQKPIIERLVRSPSLKTEIIPSKLGPTSDQSNTIQRNSEIVRKQFNLQEYGNRLIQIYQAVAASDVEPIGAINADVLLDKFLAPERFSLLRT